MAELHESQRTALEKLSILRQAHIQSDDYAHIEFQDPRRRRRLQDFEELIEFGHGSYSAVFKAKDKETSIPVALKRINKAFLVKEKRTNEVTREKDALLALKGGERVVELYFTFQDSEYLYFALQLCPNSDLQQYITSYGPQTPEVAKHFAQQLLAAIHFCHDRSIVHRDIKPDNCLLDHRLNLKLCDFACSKKLESPGRERKNSFVGTALFAAPEILNAEPASFASDLWSFACTLHYLCAGEHLFDRGSEYLIFEAICNEDYTLNPLLGEEVVDMLSKLLVVKVDARLKLDALMAHAYFQPVDWALAEHRLMDIPPSRPYLPWQPSLVADNTHLLALKPTKGPIMQTADQCPYASLCDGKVLFWDYFHLRKGFSKRIVVMVITDEQLVLVEPALTDPDPDRPRVYYSTAATGIACALAVTDDCLLVQGPRALYLTTYKDEDVDYVEHPERIMFVTQVDVLHAAAKINRLCKLI
eukprot:TRINITY_DN11571_c3_g2_i1.p1 TRINITY_DN11571_c3_g2~~TRINITY_DN11571_c3_g2_i1.p1  ORF type:complete len:474 (+),score=115.91 TRINITY_DN11571_c3_g2_i1:366-1787(+)